MCEVLHNHNMMHTPCNFPTSPKPHSFSNHRIHKQYLQTSSSRPLKDDHSSTLGLFQNQHSLSMHQLPQAKYNLDLHLTSYYISCIPPPSMLVTPEAHIVPPRCSWGKQQSSSVSGAFFSFCCPNRFGASSAEWKFMTVLFCGSVRWMRSHCGDPFCDSVPWMRSHCFLLGCVEM